MADERLARWAAERAPALLARVEAEALEEAKRLLRDALVEAALGERRREVPAPRTPPPPGAGPSPERKGDAYWVYCVSAEETLGEPPPQGVAERAVRRVEQGGLAALVTTVPLSEFGEAALKENLNDLDWLERTARAHQAVVDQAFAAGAVVPLRLCTIYESEEHVRELLEREGARFREVLAAIEGKEEWGVKLFVDPAELEEAAARRGGEVAAESGLGAGGAYLARRKADRSIREEADRVASDVAEDVHARLQDWASDAVINRPQNRELSGHEGEMLLNGAYLVERARAEHFRELVAELEERHRDLGARLEASGPWPPYNFIPAES